MFRAFIILSAFAVALTLAENSNAQGTPADYHAGTIAGGIMDSRHNLSGYGVHFRADNSDSNGGTTEICIFCHTPHHGSTNAPLWNKGNQSQAEWAGDMSWRPTTYIAYGTTISGTTINNSDIGAATLACLSCHDGLNTFDVLANAPGKGNGGSNNRTATNFNWTFTEDGNTVNDLMTSTRLNLGIDLSNDHPVSVVYDSTKASLRPKSTLISSIVLTNNILTVGMSDDNDSRKTTANRWTVLGYVNTDATIEDLLRGGGNKVECSSCHDPHFSNKSWNEVNSTWGGSGDSDGLFLRRIGGNSLSGVCRTCHNK